MAKRGEIRMQLATIAGFGRRERHLNQLDCRGLGAQATFDVVNATGCTVEAVSRYSPTGLSRSIEMHFSLGT